MMPAPVALFVYNRPWHARQTVWALLANAEAADTMLYVFSDGPRNERDYKAVAEVRSFIRGITGFRAVTLVERDKNLGLASSVIDGISRVCREHGEVIALEDDLVTSPHFLRFMNDGLAKYRDDQRVISIHGYVYPVDQKLPETFFLRGADCWGWATWKRGWALFEPDGRILLHELKRRKLTRQFDFDGSYPYTKMLLQQIAGKNDSWAIRWHASAFLQDKLTLYPGRSLVHNIGADGSGTHCAITSDYSSELAQMPVIVEDIPVVDSDVVRHAFMLFHRKKHLSLVARAYRKLWGMIFRIDGRANGKSI